MQVSIKNNIYIIKNCFQYDELGAYFPEIKYAREREIVNLLKLSFY